MYNLTHVTQLQPNLNRGDILFTYREHYIVARVNGKFETYAEYAVYDTETECNTLHEAITSIEDGYKFHNQA